MPRLWMVAFLLVSGCSHRGLDTSGYGGGPPDMAGAAECAGLDEASCKAANCVADYCQGCSCTPSFAGCRKPTDAPPPCPLYECPPPICECSGLPESACNGDARDCTAVYCPDCKGGQFYSGCVGPNESGACPAVCPDTCQGDQDCDQGWFCIPPGASPGCGACLSEDCDSDADCTVGEICEIDPCACGGTGKACVPGCMQVGCPEGQTCGVGNHCYPSYCDTVTQCPTHFECFNHSCQRIGCDSSCLNGGSCVKNFCYSAPGTCAVPPP